MIEFGEPKYKDERSFGRVWYIPISNTPLSGWRGLFSIRRDILRCSVIADFNVSGKNLKSYEWLENPQGGIIALPSTGAPCQLDFVVKKQGYDWCGITSVPIDESQYLPPNTFIAAKISVIEGNSVLGSADYIVENHGINLSDLNVRRK